MTVAYSVQAKGSGSALVGGCVPRPETGGGNGKAAPKQLFLLELRP